MNRITGLLGVLCGMIAVALFVAGSNANQKEPEKGTLVSIDGLQSRTPPDWVEEKPTSNLRFKQFRLPGAEQDKDKAELIIFFFGAGQGGTAEENIKRWKGFFTPPEGKKIDDVAKVKKMKTTSGVEVTYLDVNGTYLQKFPPNDPNAKVTRRPNYRMLGVVFESKKGPYFIRLVGPSDTVAHHQEGFDKWLKGF
jgi:hypothetical protein